MPNVQERFSYLGVMDYHNLAYFNTNVETKEKTHLNQRGWFRCKTNI